MVLELPTLHPCVRLWRSVSRMLGRGELPFCVGSLLLRLQLVSVGDALRRRRLSSCLVPWLLLSAWDVSNS